LRTKDTSQPNKFHARMPDLRNWLEARLLGGLFVAAIVLWVFIEIADEVVEGETRRIDTAILMAFRSSQDPTHAVGPAWFGEFVRDVSGLGSPGVLGLFIAVTALSLLLTNRRRPAIFVLVASLGGGLISSFLKVGFDRPRPDTAFHGTLVYDSSFPSGHAMMSAVVYLTLGALVTPLVSGTRLKIYVLGVAVMFTGLVGLSRVYLGVHWPSDVLAGWAVGTAWAIGCWAISRAADRRYRDVK